MTFDREPDLDNANVGMPDTRILGRTKYIKEVTKSVVSFFVVLKDGDSIEVVSFVGGG